MRLHQVQGRQAQVRGPRGYRTCAGRRRRVQGANGARRVQGANGALNDSLFEHRVSPARRVAIKAVQAALEVAAPAPSAGRAGPAPAMDAPAAAAEDEDDD